MPRPRPTHPVIQELKNLAIYGAPKITVVDDLESTIADFIMVDDELVEIRASRETLDDIRRLRQADRDQSRLDRHQPESNE